jgi:hypothetical protein
MTLKQHQLLSLKLGKCIAELREFHDYRTHPYWRRVSEIMDDCWRLQDSVNEDYRKLEWRKDDT